MKKEALVKSCPFYCFQVGFVVIHNYKPLPVILFTEKSCVQGHILSKCWKNIESNSTQNKRFLKRLPRGHPWSLQPIWKSEIYSFSVTFHCLLSELEVIINWDWTIITAIENKIKQCFKSMGLTVYDTLTHSYWIYFHIYDNHCKKNHWNKL